MQAPQSSTASGQQLRTGPPLGLSPSTVPILVNSDPAARPEAAVQSRRLRPWASTGTSSPATFPEGFPSSRGLLPVAEGSGLAHDASNLLGALRLYCDLLARPGVLKEEHRHYADELQLISQRSGTLVDRLLHPGTTARQGAEVAAPSASVPQVIEQCRGLLSVIARRAVEVVYGAGADTPVPVAAESLERILVNLTKNASEASHAGGSITLRVDRLGKIEGTRRSGGAGSRIVLSVEDQGCGMSVAAVKVLLADRPTDPASALAPEPDMSPEDQPQRLHGLGLVPRPAPGRGLGFRVVRKLVEASGGELRLKSRSGCGTTVEIAWAVAGSPVAGWPIGEAAGERQAVPVVEATYTTKGTKERASC